MTHPNLQDITASLHEAVETHEIGGAVMLVQHAGEIVLDYVEGWAVREPESERTPMAADTIFDLASLTKVIATTPSVLQLVEQGRVELDEPIGAYLPEFGTEGEKQHITIRRVLSHSSGITSWRGIYTLGTGLDAYIANLAEDQPSTLPGCGVEYSCMGFILLGAMVERITGQTLDAYAHQHVFAPLGMSDTSYTPAPELRDRIAATEVGNSYEHDSTKHVPPVQGWRDYMLRGEVHDGNAWYGLHGVSGNAGLFGTAADVMRYANLWLNGGELDGVRILGEDIVREAMREQTDLSSPNERRGLGWQMVNHPETFETMSSSRGLSDRAIGHTGFTGTSVWIDPRRDLISVLLTNRVHPTVNMEYGKRRAAISKLLADAYDVG